jgi:hypothetical protein
MDQYGYSIFCDDIRNEPGGKLSFIGCYNGVIFISGQFPLVLPKLCVHTHIFSPASRPFGSIVVRCYLPGDEKPFSEEPIETPEHGEQAAGRQSEDRHRSAALHRRGHEPYLHAAGAAQFRPDARSGRDRCAA